MTGRVTLVGAGPGDPELLTFKAMRVLQAADVILFDDLVSDAVFDLARREAKRILVGKRGGRPSCRQGDIEDMMVKLAKAGRHVVRLKSGDPTIFGRAGEEIARLDAEGIAVEIVPGITAATAMAAVLGVSLTHRDSAKSVRFVSAFQAGRSARRSRLAGRCGHLGHHRFYMGGRMAPLLAERLISEGLPASYAAVIASAIGRAEQQVRGCTLATLAAAAAELGLASPVLIGIGAVFASRAASRTGLDVIDHLVPQRA